MGSKKDPKLRLKLRSRSRSKSRSRKNSLAEYREQFMIYDANEPLRHLDKSDIIALAEDSAKKRYPDST